MTAIATQERATVSAERPRPRVLLAQRMKPQRDRAVIHALLRGLGIAWADAEVIAPVEAPMDVRFRQAQFHVRELGDHPWGCAWPAEDSRGPQARTHPDCGDLRHPAGGWTSQRVLHTSPPRWRHTPRGMASAVSASMSSSRSRGIMACWPRPRRHP